MAGKKNTEAKSEMTTGIKTGPKAGTKADIKADTKTAAKADVKKEIPVCPHCAAARKTVRSEETSRALMRRLKRIEGQIRGIQGMLERNAYCPEILIQVSAVNQALNSFNKELLAEHVRNCVASDIREGRDGDETIDELVKVLQKVMK